MEYQIVPMALSHVPALVALEKQCFSDPWTEAAFLPELENPYSLWLVAESDSQVVGYVGSQIVPDEADMMNLAVSAAYRGNGIAQRLVLRLIDELKARDVVSLTLEVRAHNDPAICLYEKLGFVQVGLRKNYYFHPTEDARIFKKEWNL